MGRGKKLAIVSLALSLFLGSFCSMEAKAEVQSFQDFQNLDLHKNIIRVKDFEDPEWNDEALTAKDVKEATKDILSFTETDVLVQSITEWPENTDQFSSSKWTNIIKTFIDGSAGQKEQWAVLGGLCGLSDINTALYESYLDKSYTYKDEDGSDKEIYPFKTILDNKDLQYMEKSTTFGSGSGLVSSMRYRTEMYYSPSLQMFVYITAQYTPQTSVNFSIQISPYILYAVGTKEDVKDWKFGGEGQKEARALLEACMHGAEDSDSFKEALNNNMLVFVRVDEGEIEMPNGDYESGIKSLSLKIALRAFACTNNNGFLDVKQDGEQCLFNLTKDSSTGRHPYSDKMIGNEINIDLASAKFPNNVTGEYFNGKVTQSDSSTEYPELKIVSKALGNCVTKAADGDDSFDFGKDYVTDSIATMIGAVLGTVLEQFKQALALQSVADDFKEGGQPFDVNSKEEIMARIAYLAVDKDNGGSAWSDSGCHTGNTVIYKTTLKDPNNTNNLIAVYTDENFNYSATRSTQIEEILASGEKYTFLSIKELFESLPELYQKLLAEEYLLERERLNVPESVMKFKPFYKTTYWVRSKNTDDVSVRIGGTDYHGGMIASVIAEEIKDIDEEKHKVSTILEYISYTYELGLYSVYNALFESDDDIVTVDSQGNNVTVQSAWNAYNAALNNMTGKYFTEFNEIVYVADTLPKTATSLGIDGYKWFDLTEKGVANSDWSNFVLFLHNVSMGFDIAAGLKEDVIKDQTGGANSTYGYSPEYIEELMANWQNPDPKEENFNEDKVAIEMVRAILGLHDFMDALGIPENAWTENIAKYYRLYDKLKIYEANTRISKVDIQASLPTPEEPLGAFFNLKGTKDMTDYWKVGFALSSTYVPFDTNLYDATSVSFTDDKQWISDFYYKYGFYRKALMINTDVNAVTNEILTGKKSGTRVATLKDLVYPAGDVVLTVDNNFYNADLVNTIIDKVDYTTIRGAEVNEDTNVIDKLGNAIQDAFELDAGTILKTGGASYYSSALASNCTHLEEESKFYDIASHVYDAYILNKEDIKSAIEEDEYSIKQAYAVVSAIYRSVDLYNYTLLALSENQEVFKASAGVANIASNDVNHYRTYLNYMMLTGLEKQMKNSSGNQLDLNAPIFCDIFGNIITESGDVIIPASANTTLAGNDWTPINIGFATLVGDKYFTLDEATEDFKEWLSGKIKVLVPGTNSYNFTNSTKYTENENGSGWFHETPNGFALQTCMATVDNSSMILNWKALPINSKYLKNIVYTKAYNEVAENIFSSKLVNMVLEVLRGAPIENIDFEKEGLGNYRDISKAGVYTAFKLESILNDIYGKDTTNNSMLSYPNLVFVTGVEYIVLYVYKFAFALMIIGLFINIYLDATKNSLGLKSAGNFAITIAMIIFCVTLVPQLISWSYYKANKDLLSDDMGYLVMLNYAKSLDGAEINTISLDKPSTTTKTYLKLEDIKFDWFDATTDVLFENTYSTVSEIYEESVKDSALANADNVVREGDSLYYPIEQLLKDADIVYNVNSDILSLRAYDDHGAASFISPYFVILQQLVSSVNTFNNENGISAMAVGTAGGENAGTILTYDLVSEYLTSDLFVAEGYDITGMHRIMRDNSGELTYGISPFTEDDIERASLSYWYPSGSPEEIRDKVTQLEEYARMWIAENESIFGKVPDEVLLKTFALQLAIKFNQITGCPYGNAIEIINLDSRDLFRLMVSTEENTYKYFSYGLARYTYEIGGAIGCVAMMIFVMLDKFMGMAKVVCTVIIIGLLIINVIFRKVLFNRGSQCFQGYMITCACIVLINYAYSGAMYLQMKLANWGMATAIVMIIAILVQIAYIALLIGVVAITIKDWQNNGYNEYQSSGIQLVQGVNEFKASFMDRRLRRQNPNYRDSKQKYRSTTTDGNEMLSEMFYKDKKRDYQASLPDDSRINYNPSNSGFSNIESI